MIVYLTNLKKKWFGGMLVPVSVSILVLIITMIWPEFQKQSEAMITLLSNPLYKAFLGELGLYDISTWQGFLFMYIFVWMDWIMIFVSIMVPSGLVTGEVSKRTLDLSLSYPIPRWRYLLEKFSVYLTNNAWYPLLISLTVYFATTYMKETMNYTILLQTLAGTWFMFFTLEAISLLCAVTFLEPGRSLALAGGIIIGEYILVKIGAIVDSVSYLKSWSIFNYLNAGNILRHGSIPTGDLIIVSAVGLISLTLALYIFQKREFTY